MAEASARFLASGSGWNTFGPISTPTAPPPVSAFAPAPASPATITAGSSTLHLHLGLVALLLAIYFAAYGALRYSTQADSPHRLMADRFLWCWPEVYRGNACCFYNVIFSPVILLIHAFRVYVPGCFFVYYWRLYWRLGGCCSSFYTDKEFPPNEKSLGKVGGDSANDSSGKSNDDITWVRAMFFSRTSSGAKPSHPTLNDSQMSLFEGKIEAMDILQGALGDCWLLAAMATLAEHEGAINSLFKTYMLDPRGKYHIRLYDLQEKQWKNMIIDDHVPCVADKSDPDGARRGKDGMPQAAYAKPNGLEIWVMLLEKAMAKLCGGYAAIEAGITEWGIASMTGGNAWRYELTDAGDWERVDLVPENDPKDKRACGFKSSGEKHDDEEFFDLLRYYHRNGAVLCCGGVRPAGKEQGLVPGHAFSLLQVDSVRMDWESDEYLRMVQVRNPWGTGEWKGNWSDSSKLWDQHPYVKRALKFTNRDDGSYWMQWEDFCKYWGYVGCVDCDTNVLSMRPPLVPERNIFGPLEACLRGCCSFWCCCDGPRRFFVSHEATQEQVASDVFRKSFGCDPQGAYCRLCEREMVHVSRDEVVKNALAKSGREVSRPKK